LGEDGDGARDHVGIERDDDGVRVAVACRGDEGVDHPPLSAHLVVWMERATALAAACSEVAAGRAMV